MPATPPQPGTGVPADVLSDWWRPCADYLALERRSSPHTVRNYRQAFEDLYRWLAASGRWSRGLDALTPRDARDFVIEAQRRYDRRTLHNRVSGLRAFWRYWRRIGRLSSNPFAGAPLPKLEKRLPQFLTEEQMRLLLSGPERLLAEEGGPFTCGGTGSRLNFSTAAGSGSANWSGSTTERSTWPRGSPGSGARAARSGSARSGRSRSRSSAGSGTNGRRRPVPRIPS